MNEDADPDIVEMIGAMASAFPHVQIGRESLLTYARMLQDVPRDILTAAIEQCTAEAKFIPSIADIREKVRTLTQTQALPAYEAWAVVTQEIGRVGQTDRAMIDGELIDLSPEFEDPIIAKAVDCIGWKALCNSENQIADRAHFAKVYDQLVTRHEEDLRLLPAARNLKQMTAGSVAQIIDRATRKEIAK